MKKEEAGEDVVAETLLKFLRGFAYSLQDYSLFDEEEREEIMRIAKTFDRRVLQAIRVTLEEFDVNDKEGMKKFCIGAFLGATGRLSSLVKSKKMSADEVLNLMEFYVRLIGNCAGDVKVTTVEIPKSFFGGEGKEVV